MDKRMDRMTQGKQSMRNQMPAAAELVDELREVFGAEMINKAIVAGQQARREFDRLEAERGLAHAKAWLARQKFPLGRFWASESGHEVGVRRG